ncbi:hypothetical protein IIM_00327 [Bacillus cereus VD107]|uniref:hypothetical protein n=1 Tax=Bacillus sp. LK2 TaxID=1628206 RepID=UPI00027A0B32|nr:hypothetical protein [Bacillus sp. LK2]EJR56919.1 hypothetical protein IIM_00327 [Bacillus cereus VD107]KMN46976.1 hypothetical protein VK90_01250 [Bacillus sp. LK2]
MPIIFDIYTKEDISLYEYASFFFETIGKIGLEFTKIAHYEPINKVFETEKAIEMWMHEEPGCYDDELDAMVGTAGGMLGRGSGFWYSVAWWKDPRGKSINYLTISFAKKSFTKYKQEILTVFEELLVRFNAIYGCISDEKIIDRQHITGTIKNRIPGIFAYNYFGKLFVEVIGEGKLQSLSWSNSVPLNEGLLTVLNDKKEEEFLLLEKQMKEQIGLNLFNGKSNDYPDVLKG